MLVRSSMFTQNHTLHLMTMKSITVREKAHLKYSLTLQCLLYNTKHSKYVSHACFLVVRFRSVIVLSVKGKHWYYTLVSVKRISSWACLTEAESFHFCLTAAAHRNRDWTGLEHEFLQWCVCRGHGRRAGDSGVRPSVSLSSVSQLSEENQTLCHELCAGSCNHASESVVTGPQLCWECCHPTPVLSKHW